MGCFWLNNFGFNTCNITVETLTRCNVFMKQVSSCYKHHNSKDQNGDFDVSSADADWAFSGQDFWQIKKVSVLHYLSISAWSENIIQFHTLKEFKENIMNVVSFQSFWASILHLERKEPCFKLPENFLGFVRVSFVMFPMSRAFVFVGARCYKMLNALVNLWRCPDRP